MVESTSSNFFKNGFKDSRKQKFSLICSAFGNYESKAKKRLNTSTGRSGCPFKINIYKQRDGIWKSSVSGKHVGHFPTEVKIPITKDELKILNEVKLDGSLARCQMANILRNSNQERMLKLRDIYNANQKSKRDFVMDRSTIQVVIDISKEKGYHTRFEFNSSNNLTCATFVPPHAIEFIANNGSVMFFDCTYKTNRYNMPLLHIVAVTPFNTTMSIGFSFLSGEKKEDYDKAFKHLSEIFGEFFCPHVVISDRELALIANFETYLSNSKHILCRWHINKNIVAKCKRFFTVDDNLDAFMSDCNNLWNSENEDLFNENWNKMQSIWKKHSGAINYLLKTWIPWKESIVDFWIDRHMHLGNSTSSRIEGAHSALKKHLPSSVLDIIEAFRCIDRYVSIQKNEFESKLNDELKLIPQRCKSNIYSKVVRRISKFALVKIQEDFISFKSNPLNNCRGITTRTLGIPCSHTMRRIELSGKELVPNDFHRHYWIRGRVSNISIDQEREDFDDVLENVKSMYKSSSEGQKTEIVLSLKQMMVDKVQHVAKEPVIVLKSKGRKKKDKSTKRCPSAFEYEEYKDKKKDNVNNGEWKCNFPGCDEKFKAKHDGSLSIPILKHIRKHEK